MYVGTTIYLGLYILYNHISLCETAYILKNFSYLILFIYIHILGVNLDRFQLPYQHAFGMWHETGVPGGNPCKRKGKHADSVLWGDSYQGPQCCMAEEPTSKPLCWSSWTSEEDEYWPNSYKVLPHHSSCSLYFFI